MWDSIKSAIKTVAPMIGVAIGGPIGGAATKILGDLLLDDVDATPDQIDKAIKNASPETWAKVKEAEIQFELKMRELDISEFELEQMDKNSARSREIEMAKSGNRDYTIPILAIVITTGFFGMLYAIFFLNINKDMASIADVMLGSLGAAWVTIVSYFFGSSAGSRQKDLRNDR